MYEKFYREDNSLEVKDIDDSARTLANKISINDTSINEDKVLLPVNDTKKLTKDGNKEKYIKNLDNNDSDEYLLDENNISKEDMDRLKSKNLITKNNKEFKTIIHFLLYINLVKLLLILLDNGNICVLSIS